MSAPLKHKLRVTDSESARDRKGVLSRLCAASAAILKRAVGDSARR